MLDCDRLDLYRIGIIVDDDYLYLEESKSLNEIYFENYKQQKSITD